MLTIVGQHIAQHADLLPEKHAPQGMSPTAFKMKVEHIQCPSTAMMKILWDWKILSPDKPLSSNGTGRHLCRTPSILRCTAHGEGPVLQQELPCNTHLVHGVGVSWRHQSHNALQNQQGQFGSAAQELNDNS